MKRIISIVLVCIMTLSVLASCSSDNIIRIPKPEDVNVPKTTDNDVNNTNFELMSENESLQLFVNKDTTHFKVVNKKDNKEYSTKTVSPSTNVENSLFDFTYIDTQGHLNSMTSYANSVTSGQYKIEKVENGFKTSYSVGNVQEKLFCPIAIKEEKFTKLLTKITSVYDRQYFKGYFYLVDYDKIDETKKPEIARKYPVAKGDLIYALKTDILPTVVQREINRILIAAGYDDKDYEEDSKNSTLSTESKEPAFNMNLYVTLNGDKLSVKMPTTEIVEFNGGKIATINLLKTFAAPERGEKGFFAIPDGSGSIMNFYNNAASPEIISTLYGKDDGVQIDEKPYQFQQSYLPIFINKREAGGAVLGEVVDSDASSDIVTNTGSSNTYALQYASFKLREVTKMFLSAAESDSDFFYLAQSKVYDKDMAVEYKFFEKGNDELSNITDYYRNKIFAAEKKANEVTPVYLEFIGVAKEKVIVMGATTFKEVTFTTLNQVKEKITELVAEGATNLVVKLTGFLNDGMDASVFSKIKLNKTVGTEQEFKDLIAFGEQNNIPIYLDADVQYNSEYGLFDGFSDTKDISYGLNRNFATMQTYNLAAAMRDRSTQWKNQVRYVLNPNSVTKTIDNVDAFCKRLGVKNYSFDKAGHQLNSNYKKDKEITRQEAANKLAADVSKIDAEGNILVKGANKVVLPYINDALHVPAKSLRYENANGAYPILQMVLNGKINYADEPVNLIGDVPRDNLDTLRTGSGFHYVVTTNEALDFSKTTHPEIYSNRFSFWKQNIIDKAKTLRDISPITNKGIKSYEMLQKDVFLTTYKDNGYMVTNYTEKEFDYNGTKVAPISYIIGKVGG